MSDRRVSELWINRPVPKYQARSSTLRKMLEAFISEGQPTFHSNMGYTLKWFITELESARVPYVLEARPGLGYIIRPPEPSGES